MAEPWSCPRQTKVRMRVQQDEIRKNYIGIVSDATDEKRIAERAMRSGSHVMRYLVGRLTAALRRHSKGAPGTPAP